MGTEIFMGGRLGPTVLGTANVMMAAALAEGVTVIESAACEPEVVDLANFLHAMGAGISGAGSPTITISGVKTLHGAEHEVIPDRIEAATYAIAAAATKGEVTLRGCRPDHLSAVLDKLRDAGVKIERNGPALTIRRSARLRPVDVTTLPYAGFPTDVQAQMSVLMTLTSGISVITERIFESRFMHVSELARLGADIAIEGPSAIVRGRAAAERRPRHGQRSARLGRLVLAGLVARGSTLVKRIYHLDRGYERSGRETQSPGGSHRTRGGNMRFLIGVVIIALIYLGVKSLMTHWGEVTSQDAARINTPVVEVQAPSASAAPADLMPGLPAHLENSLAAAKRQGADGLKVWLKSNRGSVRDPRLADIELDYVVMVAGKNFGEARDVLTAVKARTPEDSPVYPRLKKLEKAYR